MWGLVTEDSTFCLWDDMYGDYKEYKNDFKQVIKEREQNRSSFLHQSPQIIYRPFLVRYISEICSKRLFSKSCLHLAIYILDMFMDQHNIIPEKLLLVANVCLLLAAKFEENTQKVPKISELNYYTNNRYSFIDYLKLEQLILCFFHFDIKFPCAIHYVFYYMQEFLSYEDLEERNLRTLFYDFHEAITGYLDRIIEDVHYMQYYQPSKLGAAIIAAGRFEIGLSQWNQQLENLTDYKYQDLEEIVQILLQKNHVFCDHCIANIQ